MELRELLGNSRAIKLFDGALSVTYKPGAVTLADLGKLSNAQFLARVVTSWDLTLDGVPLEITEQAISAAPVGTAGVISEIAAEIYEDMATFPKAKLKPMPAGISTTGIETAVTSG